MKYTEKGFGMLFPNEHNPGKLKENHFHCDLSVISPQYHALGLLYHLRKNDRLAVSKMLNKFTKSGLKSPFAYCMLIRIASKLLEETEAG